MTCEALSHRTLVMKFVKLFYLSWKSFFSDGISMIPLHSKTRRVLLEIMESELLTKIETFKMILAMSVGGILEKNDCVFV